MAAAKEAQKRDEENATVQVNFSFSSASGGHGEESKDASKGKFLASRILRLRSALLGVDSI
ncbi:MAG: hypothetical protein ACLUKN_02545 [Bacilli bacterium]